MFCSHYRAHEWFFESVWNEQCQFVGVLCPNFAMFRRGECSCEDIRSSGHGQTTCALMGYDAEYAVLKQGLTKYSPQGKWYLKASDFKPQSGYHCGKFLMCAFCSICFHHPFLPRVPVSTGGQIGSYESCPTEWYLYSYFCCQK